MPCGRCVRAAEKGSQLCRSCALARIYSETHRYWPRAVHVDGPVGWLFESGETTLYRTPVYKSAVHCLRLSVSASLNKMIWTVERNSDFLVSATACGANGLLPRQIGKHAVTALSAWDWGHYKVPHGDLPDDTVHYVVADERYAVPRSCDEPFRLHHGAAAVPCRGDC